MDSKAGANKITTWQPGVSVGSYTLVRELTRGGMGEIWLARQHHAAQFERLVVLKRAISNAEEDEPASDALFLDEARISVQLQHPNIVQVYEFGRDHGSYFLAMERLAGQSLSRLMKWAERAQKPVPAPLAVEIIAAAARGLGYAHRRRDVNGQPLNIVHRDISPQNLFVTYDGEVKVLDFGIGKIAGRTVRTATGVVRGKLEYMSPEQALGQPVTSATDVFSLGVVLFELVTGTRLYQTTDQVSILNRLAYATPAPRASERATVDPALDELINTTLTWNSYSRPADGQVLFEALERYLGLIRTSDSTERLAALMRGAFAAEIAELPELAKHDTVPKALMTPLPRAWSRWLIVPVVAISASGGAWLAASPPPKPLEVVRPVVPLPEPVVIVDAGQPVVVQLPPPPPPPTVDAGQRVQRRVGYLTLETDPWARVYSGERLLGETPLIALPLPPGLQKLRLVNETEHIDTYVEFEIKADQRVSKKLAL